MAIPYGDDINHNGFKSTNLGTPVAGTDGTNVNWVNSQIAAMSSSAGALDSNNNQLTSSGVNPHSTTVAVTAVNQAATITCCNIWNV
jgi:hypothetical protein